MFKQIDEEKQKELEAEKKAEEEAKAQQKNAVEEKNPDDVDLNAPIEYGENNLKKIEEDRIKFLKEMKKFNIIKWIVSILSIGILIVGWFVFFPKDNLKYLGYIFTGIALAMMIAYFFINKKINGKKMEEYLKDYYSIVNSYVFSNGRFSDVNGDVAGKIDAIEFNDSTLYKEASQIGSRNLVKFRVDNKVDCKIVDLAAQKSTQKKLVPIFIGKYLIANNNYNLDDPIYIYLPGNSRALPPNNIDGVPKVVNTKKLVVHSNNRNYEKYFNSKVRSNVTKLITNNILVDCCMAITKGKTYVGLGYDDCLMVLPYQEQFNPKPVERFNADMEIVATIISEIADIK